MRKLLATTALVALVSAPILIGADSASAKVGVAGVMNVTTITNAHASGYMASNLIGQTVYTSAAADAEAVGDINDVVIGEDGKVHAVIIGAGGFIGLGEKEVAVDFSRLKIQNGADNKVRVVAGLTKKELEAAPAVDGKVASSAGAAASAGVASVGSAISSTTTKLTDKATAMVNGDKKADKQAFLSDKTKVDAGSVSIKKMTGARVYDSNWNDVGEIGEVLATADGKFDAAVVDVGGFLGLGEKPVAIGLDQLEFYKDTSGDIYVATPYTEKQLESAIAYDAKVYGTKRGTMRLTPNG